MSTDVEALRAALAEEREARAAAEAALARTRASTSYRVGNVLVRLVVAPLGVLRGAVAGVLAFLRRRLPHETRERILDVSGRVLPKGLMARLRRMNNASKGTRIRKPRVTAPASHGDTGPRRGDSEASGSLLSDDVATHGYVVIDPEPDELATLASRLIRTSMIRGDHVPLIITDSLEFEALSSTGIAFEYIPSREHWGAALFPDDTYDDFFRRRLDHLVDVHAITRVVADPSIVE